MNTCQTVTPLLSDNARLGKPLYRRLYEVMIDAFAYTDVEGHILEFNEAFRQMLGYEADELRQLTYLDITPEKWHAFEANILNTQVHERDYSDVYEKEYRRKDGSIFPIEVRATLVRDETGDPCGYWGIIRDITERKKAEEELRQSEAKYRALQDSIRDGFAKMDMDGRLIENNRIFQEMLGYTAEELHRLTYQDITPQKWHAMEARILAEEVLKHGYSELYEKEYRRKDGTIFPVELRTILARDENGKPACMWAMVRDITERRNAEMALVAGETKYFTLHESMMDAFGSMDMEGNIIEFNDVFQDMLGYSAAELHMLTHKDLTPEKWHELDDRIIEEQILPRGYSDVYEKEYGRKDGSLIPVELRFVLIKNDAGKPAGMWAMIRDITERKRTEKELNFRNLLLSTQQEASIDGILIIGESGDILSFNQRFVELWSIPPEVLATKSDSTALGWILDKVVDPKCFMSKVQYLYQNHYETSRDELTLKDGRIFDRYSAPMVATDGMYYGRVWFFRDITERKRAEDDLALSEERFRKIFENGPLGIGLSDPDHHIIKANPALCQMLGYSEEELIRLTIRDAIHPDDLSNNLALLAQLRDNKIPLYSLQIRARRKDGKFIWVNMTVSYVRDDEEKPLYRIALMENITERKLAEDRFRDIVLSSGDWVWEVDKNGAYVYISDRVESILGYKPAEILGKNPFDLMPEDEAKRIAPVFVEILSGKKPIVDLENWNLTKDGRLVCLLTNGVPVLDANGDLRGYRGVDKDITERKRADEALAKSEEKYRTVIENMQDVFYRTDLAGNLTMLSPSGPRYLGYDSVEKMIGVNIARDLYANPEDRDNFLREIQTKGSVRDFEVTLKRIDGSLFYASANSQFYFDSDGKLLGVEGILRDIHERKIAQQALQASEERYRLLIENAGEAIFVIQDYKISYSNDRLAEILGYSREEVFNNVFVNYIHPDDRDLVVRRFQARVQGETVGKPIPVRVLASDGNYKWLQVDAVKIVWDGGPATLNFATDVTEQIITQNNLKENEIKFRTIFEHSADALVLGIDSILDCNQITCELLGFSREEIIGHLPIEFAPENQPDSRNSEEAIAGYAKAAFEGSSQCFLWQFKKKDGTPINTQVSLKVLTLNNKQILFGVIRDVNQLNKAEETSRKMAAANY